MHRILLTLLLAVPPLAAAAGPSDSAAPAAVRPISVAVFDFSSYYPNHRREATDLLIADLSADPRFAVLDRGELDKILGERAMSLTQELDVNTAAHLGQLAGADVIITGVLSRADNEGNHFIIVRIIGANSGRAFSEQIALDSFSRMQQVVEDLAQKIAAAIETHAAVLIAPPGHSHADAIAAIAGKVAGSRRPAVAIEITEQRDGKIVADATVETELGLILQKAGFPVVDGLSGQRPDIKLTGDAVGDPGPMQGVMCFAQAAVNLRVIDCASGKILDFERQTAEATDLGKKMAVDGAYQNAADALATKLLPLLSR